jgi:hypothetical protein
MADTVVKPKPRIVRNKGTGAGGANTNKNGKTFEEKTANKPRLLAAGFTEHKIPGSKGKFNTYLEKPTEAGSIIYLSQGALKAYFQWKFKLELFRAPDEAYLIRNGANYTLRILEKKNQNVEGSVDTKLLSGPSFVREYELSLNDTFTVEYAFCLSSFLEAKYNSKTKKFEILKMILQEANIPVFFGDQPDYFTKLDAWVYS